MKMSELPTVTVETTIAAEPDEVFSHLADLDTMAGHGTEFQGGEWTKGRPGELGSTFVGRQRMGEREWESVSTVTTRETDRSFGWTVGDVDDPVARWTFELRRVPTGTEVSYTAVLGPGRSGLTAAIDAAPDREAQIIDRRLSGLQENMVKTLEGIRRLVERT